VYHNLQKLMFWLHKILYQQTATMQNLEISKILKITTLENYVFSLERKNK